MGVLHTLAARAPRGKSQCGAQLTISNRSVPYSCSDGCRRMDFFISLRVRSFALDRSHR